MIVRLAVLADVPNIVSNAIQLASDRYHGDAPEYGHIEGVVVSAIQSSGSVVAVLETDDGLYSGVFIGAEMCNPISARLTLVEVMFYLPPDRRGHGKKLLNFVCQIAASDGCSEVFLSHPNGADRAGLAFKAWGFELAELHYRKAIK
jgi:GNAT superfamily N-acetyltransferase